MVTTSASIKQKRRTQRNPRRELGLHFKLAFGCHMYNSEVTAPASKFTRDTAYEIASPSLCPCSSAGAKLTKGDKGEFYAYSVIPFVAFVQSQEGIRELYNGHHLRFISMQSFMQFFFSMPAVKRREVSRFVHIADILRPYSVYRFWWMNTYNPANSAGRNNIIRVITDDKGS